MDTTITRRWVYFFGQGQADGGSDIKHLIGGKGASLADMTRGRLNVPPGFTISAECCDLYYKRNLTWPEGLQDEVRANLQRLEKLAVRTFGRGPNPLLVAVRSGAAQSMPGMMDTILNVGLNPACVQAMADRTGNHRSAWEAYYHFLLMYVRTVQEPTQLMTEEELASIIQSFLHEQNVALEEDLDAGRFENLCRNILRWSRKGPEIEFPTEPWDLLVGAVNAVFRSWNSDRAITYRKHHKIEGLLGTAVNVQMMCPSEVSGVLFTANPVNPALDQMIVESSYGLGEAIVLGKVTPDRFVLDRRNLALVERNIAHKDKMTATLAQDGKGQTGAKDAASLTDAQVLELAKLGARVEDYFKHPCDIEWGLSQGQFFLLQARAIKGLASASSASGGRQPPGLSAEPGGLPPPRADATERERIRQEEIAALQAKTAPSGTVWSHYNLSEILPEPTPMTWAIVKRFMSGKGGFGLMYRDLGFDPDPALDEEGIFDLVCGRPYCNLSREPKMQYRRLPFEHKFAYLKGNPAKAIYPQAVPNLARAGWRFWLFWPFLLFQEWRCKRKIERLTRTFAREFQERIVPAFSRDVEAVANQDLGKLSGPELLDGLNHWIKRTLIDFARDSLKPTALAGAALGELERVLALRYQPPGAVTKPGEPPIGTQKAQAALRELVMGVKPSADADLPGALHALGIGGLAKEEFLKRFGHRGSHEMELAQPRWSEDPDAVDRMAAEPGNLPPQQNDAGSPEALARTWDKIAGATRLMAFQVTVLEKKVQTLHTYLGLRETAKHHLLRGYALIRRFLVEFDRRFQLAGGIFFLTPDELPQLAQGDPKDAKLLNELRALIEQRRQRRALALSLELPQVLFSDDLEAIGREVDVTGADVLQGVPLSAGVVEGPAWVLLEPAGAQAPHKPYILVCPSTDPAWVPLFVQAGGLVMETGGLLSHGAIVAREFGLPAVAGIPEVHRRLRTGQRLRLDGATGKITVLS